MSEDSFEAKHGEPRFEVLEEKINNPILQDKKEGKKEGKKEKREKREKKKKSKK